MQTCVSLNGLCSVCLYAAGRKTVLNIKISTEADFNVFPFVLHILNATHDIALMKYTQKNTVDYKILCNFPQLNKQAETHTCRV